MTAIPTLGETLPGLLIECVEDPKQAGRLLLHTGMVTALAQPQRWKLEAGYTFPRSWRVALHNPFASRPRAWHSVPLESWSRRCEISA